MKIKCPFCDKEQKQEPKKTWTYGKMIEKMTKNGMVRGASCNCSIYLCDCGKSFKFYLTTKGKYWTIPKSKKIHDIKKAS